MSLHHKLCHVLGGSFGLPHAETHTIVLPHAIAFNKQSTPDAMNKLAAALPDSDGDAIRGLNILLDRLQVKRSLKEYGMKSADIRKAAEIATSNSYWNPREVSEKDVGLIEELIRRCWAGEAAKANL
jgi:alcohol dehydrogenase class IV